VTGWVVVSEREVDVATSGWRNGDRTRDPPNRPHSNTTFKMNKTQGAIVIKKPIQESPRYLSPSHSHLKWNYTTEVTVQHQATMACCHGCNFLCPFAGRGTERTKRRLPSFELPKAAIKAGGILQRCGEVPEVYTTHNLVVGYSCRTLHSD